VSTLSSKTTVIIDRLSFEMERVSSVFGNPITADSMGNVTSCSTSTAAMPGAEVTMVT